MPGRGCEKVTVFEVIEAPLLQPVNVTMSGAAEAPSQLGDDDVPVPGQEWHEAQSCDPGAEVKLLWSRSAKPVPGLTFMWQSLQRPEVPFITSGFPALKLVWNEACAHSLPCTPFTFETPFCVWQKLQSWLVALMSVWLI